MSKLTFRRAAGTSSLVLDDQATLELQPEELLEILSALTTEGGALELELQAPEAEEQEPEIGTTSPSPSPSPHDVRDSMGSLALLPVTPPLFRRFSQPPTEPWKVKESEGISFTRSGREHAERMGLTDQEAQLVLDDPEIEVVIDSGNAAALVRGDIGLKVFLDNDTIFGVYDAETVRRQIAQHTVPVDKRHIRGGDGGRHPTDTAELVSVLSKMGFDIEKSARGHFRVRSQDGKRSMTLASTPSDHRTLINTIKKTEQVLGITLRDK